MRIYGKFVECHLIFHLNIYNVYSRRHLCVYVCECMCKHDENVIGIACIASKGPKERERDIKVGESQTMLSISYDDDDNLLNF